MKTARTKIVLWGVSCLGVVLLTWAGARWYSLRHAAWRAIEELAACRKIAAEIEAGRDAPPTALLEKQSEQQISLLIERAAQEAAIADSDILRITPQQGLRRKKAAHVEQPTTVQLRQVTLGQLSRFLGELAMSEVGLQPTSIRLTAPRTPPSAAPHEIWACELVLTYLIFSPE